MAVIGAFRDAQVFGLDWNVGGDSVRAVVTADYGLGVFWQFFNHAV